MKNSEEGLTQLQMLGRLLVGAPPRPGLDWEALSRLAHRYGMSPLLYYRLREQRSRGEGEGEDVAVPEEVGRSLRLDYQTTVALSMAAEQQLALILEALAAVDVPVLVVKGPSVAAYYPHPALRAYRDLDLLVREAQLNLAEAALNELGYRSSRPSLWTLDLHQHLPRMTTESGQHGVEIHHRLDDPERVGRLPVEDLWARAVPWSLKGKPALRLEAVDAVLYLCRHAFVQHLGREYLQPVCDMAQVTADWMGAEWAALMRRAADYGLVRAIYMAVILMEQILGRTVPQDVVDALDTTCGGPPAAELVTSFLHAEKKPGADVPASVVQAWTADSLRERVLHLLRRLFLPKAVMSVVYDVPADAPGIWLTYLWRPRDLLQQYWQATWGALRGESSARAAWNRQVRLEKWLGEGRE